MWLGFILVLAITLPAMVVMRKLLARRVAAMMLRLSPTGAGSMAMASADELPPARPLRLAWLDASTTPPETGPALASPGARQAFVLWWAADALGALTILLVGGMGKLALVYLVLLPLRCAYHLRLLRRRGASAFRRPGFFRRWVSMLFEQLVAMFFQPHHAWFPLALVALVTLAEEPVNALVGVPAGVAIFLLLRRLAVRRMQAEPNHRLLILRVFGRDANADLTFGALRRAWQCLGTSFTVVDRSYIGFKYRGHSEDHVAVALYGCLPVVILAIAGRNPPTLEVWAGLGLAIGLVLVLGYAVALAVMHARAPRVFAADAAHIRSMIGGVLQRPRAWSLFFRDLDMYCFDNTWRLAVGEFIAESDVVLMDLRGYAASNTGCNEELDRLFDSVPVGRIVLLVDAQNAPGPTAQLLQERWRLLDRRSPNLALVDPVLAVYRVQGQDTADVGGLVQVLLAAASGGRGQPLLAEAPLLQQAA